jgi:hypothetical protein
MTVVLAIALVLAPWVDAMQVRIIAPIAFVLTYVVGGAYLLCHRENIKHVVRCVCRTNMFAMIIVFTIISWVDDSTSAGRWWVYLTQLAAISVGGLSTVFESQLRQFKASANVNEGRGEQRLATIPV